YRVLRADSGTAAMEIVRELKLRNNPVALFLVDQRMPGLSGVQFLEQAMELFPDAKRVLLTAYADTDAAIAAINEAGINHYLLKPWDPPEENLYPVLDELLEDWEAAFPAQFEGIRVLGNRWSPSSHSIKDFLARNHVPYRWLDIETAASDEEVRSLIELLDDEETHNLPIVILPNGVRLKQPTLAELAEHAGLRTRATEAFYDLAIVGGGPAGLAAAVYGASEGLRTVMIEREAPGGQAGQSSKIENYLGFPQGLSGSELTQRATSQARRLGAELLTVQDAVGLRVEGSGRFVELSGGGALSANCVLVASGVAYRKLDTPGFPELTGAGIYYGAAVTEARSCADQHVVIIGGANSAGQAAVYFSEHAAKVTMLVRSTLEKSMSHYLIERIDKLANIEVRAGTEAVAAEGEDGHLARLRVRNGTGGEDVVAADACFVFIGAAPRTDWLAGVVMR